MLTRNLALAGMATPLAVGTSSLEGLVTDTIVGVLIAIVVFALYYALVLRKVRGGQRGDS